MRSIDLFLFDLDGTLIDSKRDIANSVNYTMRELGLDPLPDETIYEFVGHGVTPLIQKSLATGGMDSFERALKIFRTHYDAHLLDATLPFTGIPEVLEHFKGKTKIVVTNKSQAYSEKILKGLNIGRHFKGVFGGDTKFPKKPDPEIVHYLLETYGIDSKKTVIIGDSRVDIETGRKAGILTCGATWGFRPRRELEESGCDWLIERPEELVQIFL